MTRLFHVSDLHFGREDIGAVRWFAETVRAGSREFAAAQAWLATLGVPVTIEPGNHDLPYLNPLARLLHPYRRVAAVVAAIERPLALPGVLLVPLKTTARFQLRNLSWGRVSRSGLEAALGLLKRKPAGAVALVACHHPLVRTGFEGHGDTRRGTEALAALAQAGADAVLSGHVHDAFDVEHQAAGRSVRLIGAGTLSRRLRATPPSFNELRVGEGGLEVVERVMR